MSKYESLGQFLDKLKAEQWRPTFLELERVLASKLPAAAGKNAAWWKAEIGHARAWLDSGWKVDAVDLEKQVVSFSRTAARAAGEAADAYVPGWRDKAEAGRDAAVDQLREHPLTAVAASAATAFALGIALGYLLVRSTRSPEPVIELPEGFLATAESRARRALSGLAAGLHELEDAVSERVRKLRS